MPKEERSVRRCFKCKQILRDDEKYCRGGAFTWTHIGPCPVKVMEPTGSGMLYDLETAMSWTQGEVSCLSCPGGHDGDRTFRQMKVLRENPLIAVMQCGICLKRWLRVEEVAQKP